MKLLVVLLALGGVVLAACSSNTSSSSTTSPPNSAATTTAPSPSSTVAPASSTTITRPGGPSQCATSSLTASVYGGNGAAGTIETTIALTSSAATSCTLGGYPGLQMLSASGSLLPTNVVRKGTYSFTAMAPSTVSVVPGHAVYFNMGYSDVPSGSETSCPTSATLRVTPPNSYGSVAVATHLSPCDKGSIAVSPVFAGTAQAA
jgi:hypothetical protein